MPVFPDGSCGLDRLERQGRNPAAYGADFILEGEVAGIEAIETVFAQDWLVSRALLRLAMCCCRQARRTLATSWMPSDAALFSTARSATATRRATRTLPLSAAAPAGSASRSSSPEATARVTLLILVGELQVNEQKCARLVASA